MVVTPTVNPMMTMLFSADTVVVRPTNAAKTKHATPPIVVIHATRRRRLRPDLVVPARSRRFAISREARPVTKNTMPSIVPKMIGAALGIVSIRRRSLVSPS